MSRILPSIPLLLFLLLSNTSCEKSSSAEFQSVEATPVYIDSLNIRALAPLDENRVWFAANHGKIGLIDVDTPKIAVIKHDDQFLHFRSIGRTDEAIFVLSIASPAVLYKIGFDGEEATNIEEVYFESGEKVFYDSMKFWNNEEGIAIGDPITDCMAILITRDGGNSWQKISCEALPSVEKGEVAFAASNSNIAVYGDHAWIATGGKRSRVLHTADKGKSWSMYDTPIISGDVMTGIFSVDFYDEKIGVVAGGNWKEKDMNSENKALTKDGGKSWSLLADGQGPGYISSIKFVPDSEGEKMVTVGPNGIYYSGDEGKSWKQMSEEVFYALEFVNDSLAFASGENKISKLIFKK